MGLVQVWSGLGRGAGGVHVLLGDVAGCVHWWCWLQSSGTLCWVAGLGKALKNGSRLV